MSHKRSIQTDDNENAHHESQKAQPIYLYSYLIVHLGEELS